MSSLIESVINRVVCIHLFHSILPSVILIWQIAESLTRKRAVCLRKKVVIKRSGAVKVVAQYIGDTFRFRSSRKEERVGGYVRELCEKRSIEKQIFPHRRSGHHHTPSCGPMHCGTSLAGTPELFLFGIVFLLLY